MKLQYNLILFVFSLSWFNFIMPAGVSSPNKQDIEQWFYAAENNYLHDTKHLIGRVNVNTQNENGDTALILAAEYARVEIVKFLLQAPDINVNVQNKHGETALMKAASRWNDNIIELFWDVPSLDVNVRSNKGHTALMFAALHYPASQGGERDIVVGREWNAINRLLQIEGININAELNGKTALMVASPVGAKLIQEKIDELGKQAFDAINYNSISILKDAIAQIGTKVKDINGDTLLESAIKQKNIEMVTVILRAEPRAVKLLDKNGDTILHKAIKQKNIELVAAVLLVDSTCLDINDKDGKDAIELSVGYPEIFDLIMKLTEVQNPCANPSCPNPKKECKKLCAGCKKVCYCSLECHKQHWNTHKQLCKRLKNS